MLSRIFLLLSITLLSQAVKKDPREFSLFSVVTFKHGTCQAVSAAITGTCMTTQECTDGGGTADGNCASGFGSCCIFKVSTCGGVVSKNCTYIESTGYPTTTTATTACSYTVQQCQDSICQIRLDFTDFVSEQPATTGICTNTILTITPGTTGTTVSTVPPVVCGTLTGQHMYIDSGRQTTAATLAFTFAAASTVGDKWRIKVSQIGCSNPNRAPEGCLQYFYGGNLQTVTSFNFDGTDAHATGGLLRPQQYVACFRRESGMCGLTYTTTVLATGLLPFEMEESAISEVGTDCANHYIDIPAPNGSAFEDQLCGGVLDRLDAAIALSFGRTIVANDATGWEMGVIAEAVDTTGLSGFSLDVAQTAC